MTAISHANWLPAPARPPHDPRRLPLGPIPGWRARRLDAVAVGADGALRLAKLPAAERRLNEAGGTLGGLILPPNLAVTTNGALLLLDREQALVRRFDPCACAFVTLPCTGGPGGEARALHDPAALAVCGERLLIADAGHARVVVYGLPSLALRAFWAPPAAALAQPWRPVDLAVGEHRFLVADPANGCVHRFDAAGRWHSCIPGVGAVSRIALGTRGRLYVIVDESQPARVLDLASGDTIGFAERPEAAADAFPPMPFEVRPDGLMDLGPLCGGEAWFDPAGLAVPPPPPAADVPTHFSAGRYVSEALDSHLYRCQWDRLVLDAQVPEGGRVQVLTYSAETALAPAEVDALPESAWSTRQIMAPGPGMSWDCLLRAAPGRYLWLRLDLTGDGWQSPAIGGLVIDFPRISLRRYLPAIFGEEPVAADFSDRFLAVFDRGLRELEGELDRLAGYFDPLSAPADPGRRDFLTWLAGWVGVTLDRQLPLARRRALVQQAGRLFACRGTVTGLRRMLELYLGLAERACPAPAGCGPCTGRPETGWQRPELILEHFRLRRWLFLDRGRLGEQARLWGQSIVNRSQLGGSQTAGNARLGVTQLKTTQDPYRDPFHVYAHRFTLFLPGWVGRDPARRTALERLLRAEKPAHAEHSIRYVEPRFRVGVQAVIGFDSVVGCWPQGVRLADDGAGDRLGRATVLGGAAVSAGGAEGRTRIGASSRLR